MNEEQLNSSIHNNLKRALEKITHTENIESNLIEV